MARPRSDAALQQEFVELLYKATFNIVFITFAAAGLCGGAGYFYGDTGFLLLAGAAVLVGGLRFANDIDYRRRHVQFSAAVWERRHVAGSLGFSVIVGAIGFHSFTGGPPAIGVFAITFLVSYATGVISRLSVRPRLAMTAVAVAAIPYIVSLLLDADAVDKLLGLFIFAMLAASSQLIRTTYRLTHELLTTRAELAERAGMDALTGLANRVGFDAALRARLADGALGPGHGLAVYFIDLDHFKAANDTYGHAAGDAILAEVGRRLTALLPVGAVGARRGGDEFLVVQPALASLDEAARFARAVLDSLSAAYHIAGQTITIGCSLGIAVAEDGSTSPERLIVAADQALYEAKGKGRGTVAFHKPQDRAA